MKYTVPLCQLAGREIAHTPVDLQLKAVDQHHTCPAAGDPGRAAETEPKRGAMETGSVAAGDYLRFIAVQRVCQLQLAIALGEAGEQSLHRVVAHRRLAHGGAEGR